MSLVQTNNPSGFDDEDAEHSLADKQNDSSGFDNEDAEHSLADRQKPKGIIGKASSMASSVANAGTSLAAVRHKGADTLAHIKDLKKFVDLTGKHTEVIFLLTVAG